MTNEKAFGNCLSELLQIFSLKGSTLARGINVDSSLVYKWLRNERVPSYNSAYIDLITEFFVNNISNSFQKEMVVDTFKKWSLQEKNPENISIKDNIRTHLLEAQGYSIELLANKINRNNNVKNLSKDMPLPGFDVVKIISGHEEVLRFSLDTLEKIPKNPIDKDDTILITLNSDMDLFPSNKVFNERWKKILENVLQNGWKIVYLVKLNNNKKRTIKIIEDMQLALCTSRYYLYYYKDISNTCTENELIIVPNVGALYCFSSQLKDKVDSAFFFKSKESIKILSGHFFQFFSSAKPLLKSYNSKKAVQLNNLFIEAEEALGDKYVFKKDISTITLPIVLYEKYLKAANRTEEEISEYLFLHKRRLHAFKTQIKYYKFKDIFFKESIEKLILEKKYSFDPYYIYENNILRNEDIICHLKNIIYMLEKYNNYEIAIVNRKDYENITKLSWMVKENNSVFISPCTCNIKNKAIYESFKDETNLFISENDVVDAFSNYFFSLWNDIPNPDKEKKSVIKWIQSQIALLEN